MTITSDELNYLIWRYLQEQGLEISAFALQDETAIDKFDTRYNKRIPLGCLINLIQKGILYCEEDELVTADGKLREEDISKKFNLFDALEKDKQTNPHTVIDAVVETKNTAKDTSSLNVEGGAGAVASPAGSSVSESFTTVLTKSFTFEKSEAAHWNPRSSAVLAWGQRNCSSVIAVLDEKNDLKSSLSELKLEHPSAVPFTSSSTNITSGLDSNNSNNSNNGLNSGNDITSVRWSQNGDMLVTASESGALRLWTTDGKLMNVMMLHNSPIITIKWLKQMILTKDTRKTIVWDSTTGLAIQHLEDTTGGIDACFIDETKIAVPSGDYSIVIHDLVHNVALTKLYGHTDNISIIDYSQELKLLVTASDDMSIRIWKGDSVNPTQIIMGHSQIITYVGWLRSSTFVLQDIEMLISTSVDGTIRIWNIYTAELLFLCTNNDGASILQAAVSPDYKWLATGDVDGIVTVWDISIESLNKSYEKTASSSSSSSSQTVASIKSKSQYQPDLVVDQNFITSIDWSPDSQKIAVSYSEIESAVLCI